MYVMFCLKQSQPLICMVFLSYITILSPVLWAFSRVFGSGSSLFLGGFFSFLELAIVLHADCPTYRDLYIYLSGKIRLNVFTARR